MVAILSLKPEAVLDAVRIMYTDVAEHPEREFHFPTGRAACLFVGYPEPLVDALPATAVESFAGVGYPFAAGSIAVAQTVLDIGSGSGTDALICSRLVGSRGRVIGLDVTPSMLRKLEANAAAAGAANLEGRAGSADAIPLEDASVDVVTSNGVINLVPDKARVTREIFRVLRPGGRVQIADIVLQNPASDACRANPELWAECVVGATVESAYLECFRAAGFVDVQVLSSFDYFAGSSSAATRDVARSLGAHAIVMKAARPA